jgi:hypothetical protein
MRAPIQISDPWEFPDLGALDGEVVEFDRKSARIRLDKPIQYRNRSIRMAEVETRHTGDFFRPGGSINPANIILRIESATLAPLAYGCGRRHRWGTLRP